MTHLSNDYYLRKCYLERDEIPSRTVMIEKMRPHLANIFIKNLTPKQRVLAGFDEKKGGGSSWYVPPEEVLAGRVVLKPMDKGLTDVGVYAINHIGEKLKYERYKELIEEKRQLILESDKKWKNSILVSNRTEYEEICKVEAERNTREIVDSFHQFEVLYTTSVGKLEGLVYQAASKEVERIRNETFIHMEKRCAALVKCQATSLYKGYEQKLEKEKARQKATFIKAVEKLRKDMANKILDINYEKHTSIEKMRQMLNCENLACQIYVALKEKEACENEMKQTKRQHQKKVKVLQEEINMQNVDFRFYEEHEARRKALDKIWKKKICHVVKKFQLFIEYCLRTMPHHAEFFINMEKLLLLQLSEALEEPDAESIFESESEPYEYKPPVARPHPFYLFCDKGAKPSHIDANLCPKHCTSSASHLPLIVINKRYFYSACDNYDMFADKMTQYICGNRGDDVDIEESEDYHLHVPVKCTSAERLQELKLESSLLQILQQESPNVNGVPIACAVCKLPYCYCSVARSTSSQQCFVSKLKKERERSMQSVHSSHRFMVKSKLEPQMRRAPTLENYIDYVTSNRCQCAKMAKKQIRDHLPPYMRMTSKYEPLDLPHYEPCTLTTLKQLVKYARVGHTPQSSTTFVKRRVLKKDASTQYSDHEFDLLCTCFSDDEIPKNFEAMVKRINMSRNKKYTSYASDNSTNLLEVLLKDSMKLRSSAIRRVDDVSSSYLMKSPSSFVTDRAYSLRNLLDCDSNLEEIFTKVNCDSK